MMINFQIDLGGALIDFYMLKLKFHIKFCVENNIFSFYFKVARNYIFFNVRSFQAYAPTLFSVLILFEAELTPQERDTFP